MTKVDKSSKADKRIDKQMKKFEKMSEAINAILGATVNMHDEIKQINDQVVFTLKTFEAQKAEWEKKIEQILDLRKRQLTAAKEASKKIEKDEYEGATLQGKALIAHILSTNQLIFEQLGQYANTLTEIKTGLRVLDERTTSFEMTLELVKEQVLDFKNESMRLISRLVKLLAVALATIAAVIGVDRLLAMFNFIK